MLVGGHCPPFPMIVAKIRCSAQQAWQRFWKIRDDFDFLIKTIFCIWAIRLSDLVAMGDSAMVTTVDTDAFIPDI
jgi:hypothetical protein